MGEDCSTQTKLFPVEATKAYVESRQLHSPSALQPRKQPPLPIEWDDGCAPELDWTL